MALKLITPGAAIFMAADVKPHLRVDIADDDALINSMLLSATEMAEQATGRALMSQTWELTLDAFPTAFKLSRVPVRSITSIKYIDLSGTLQTLDPSQYTLDNASDFSAHYVVPAYGTNWPATQTQINAVTCRYVCGYADAASVPGPIKDWMKCMVGAMYENRAAETMQEKGVVLSLGFVDRLLDRYKMWEL